MYDTCIFMNVKYYYFCHLNFALCNFNGCGPCGTLPSHLPVRSFNTIVPCKLLIKPETLGLDPALCNWVLDFLTGRTQVVRGGNNISTLLILNTGAPQACVLSPLLYSLFNHDCVAMHASNSIIKFVNKTRDHPPIHIDREEIFI
jgi:hypothetical protein